MANFITTSITWEGKSNFEKLLKPMFVGKSVFATKGVRVMPNIQSKTYLNLWGSVNKVLKAYAKGFSAASGSTYTRKSIDVYQMKAEISEDGNEFWQTVYEQLLGKGVDMNDLSKAAGQLEDTVIEIFMNAFESDTYRQFWLSDTNKETVVSGVQSGTGDVNYNAYDGMWKKLIDDSSASPTSSQIKAFDYDTSSVKQVRTGTTTGTSGTASFTWQGTAYLLTFDTSLTQTNANFVTANAAAFLLRGVVLTASVATLIMTSSVPGQPFGAPVYANVTGDLAGTLAATTANTAPIALTADQAIGQLKTMYTGSDAALKALKKTEKVFLVDGYTYENLMSTYEGWKTSTPLYSSESGRIDMIDGVEFLRYRGVPVINLDWENDLDADFTHASGELPPRVNRIIYTAINNLVLGIDAMSDFSKFEFWYNKDEQENRYRFQTKMGAAYVFNNIVSLSYEI